MSPRVKTAGVCSVSDFEEVESFLVERVVGEGAKISSVKRPGFGFLFFLFLGSNCWGVEGFLGEGFCRALMAVFVG